LDNHTFWRWVSFPEVATLRTQRWRDLPAEARSAILNRLLIGPDKSAFRNDDVPEAALLFHRDHELARLVDAALPMPDNVRHLVDARRKSDPEFPSHIAAIEPGLPGPQSTWVSPGSPARFDGVPSDKLLLALIGAHGEHKFGVGSDAEAFARTSTGKRRVLEAIVPNNLPQGKMEFIWELLLSYPHEKGEDANADREFSERILLAILSLPAELFSKIADQACYWVDAADEKFPRIEGGDRLWGTLLPHAEALANEHVSTTRKADIDLTMAALNEPLGHLLSLFLRRCPNMPVEISERSPLPGSFVQPLKQLSGRAKEMVAARMAPHISYFERADRPWLSELVLVPMKGQTKEANRVWEAFAKYSQVPSATLWEELQQFVFRRLSSSELSPEAKRQLAKMSLIVWVRSKTQDDWNVIDANGFRGALGLSNDDVRSAVAWRLLTLFDGTRSSKEWDSEDDEGEQSRINEDNQDGHFDRNPWPKIGAAFFREIWPMEPALQSAKTAKSFARLPARAGAEFFSQALSTALPYLLPFEVWSVQLEFSLGNNPYARKMICQHPEELLTLLSTCISDAQTHRVIGLKPTLAQIVDARKALQSDHRVRRLRQLASE
jgi:hypothetical protein